MNVVILEPAPRDNFWFHTNVRTPHLGPPILAGVLNRRGHRAAVLSELVGPIDYRRVAAADLVGISLNTTLTHQVGYEIAARVRVARPGVPVVAGGHHATLNPREALGHVDYVVRGYAEQTFPDLVDELARGEVRPRTPGVSYRDPDSGRMVHNQDPRAADISHLADLDTVVGYQGLVRAARWQPDAYGRFLPLSYYSRGCAFSCHFCSVPLADGPRMAYRDAAQVVED